MDYSTTALLVIDVQEDFLPPHGSLAVGGGRDIVGPIVDLMSAHAWKTVVVTKDWHPKDHISFASNHVGKAVFDVVPTQSPSGDGSVKDQVLWPDHCVQGTKGSDFPPELQTAYDAYQGEKKLVLKGYLQDREYYSCFGDIWNMHHTECGDYLHAQGVKTVVVVGLAYDYCVFNSSVDAQRAGFDVVILQDLTRAVDPTKNDETASKCAQNGVKVAPSSILS